MAAGFSFEEAKQPAEPQGFSFDEAKAPAPVGFSFDEAKQQTSPYATTEAEPKTTNMFMGALGRLAEGTGSTMEGVAEVGTRTSSNIAKLAAGKGATPEQLKAYEEGFKFEIGESLFGVAKSLKKFNEDIGYAPTTKLGDLADNPLKVVPFIIERLVVSSPDMAAAYFAMPLYFTGRTKEILDERVKNDNKTLDEATIGDLTAAASGALVEATFERFATGRLGLRPTGATAGTRIAKETGIQAGTEAIEESAAYLGETALTKKGVDLQEMGERALEGAIVGGGLGAGVQAGKEYLGKGRSKKEQERDETADEHIREIESGLKNIEDYTPEEIAEIERRRQEEEAIKKAITETDEGTARTGSPIVKALEDDISKSFGENAQQIFDLADELLDKGAAVDRVGALTDAVRTVAGQLEADQLATEETAPAPERVQTATEFQRLLIRDGLSGILDREPTAAEIQGVVDEYEQTPGVSIEDVLNRFESSISVPSGELAGDRITGEPSGVEAARVGVPGAPAGGVGVGTEVEPGALEAGTPQAVEDEDLKSLLLDEGLATGRSDVEDRLAQGFRVFGFREVDETDTPYEITNPEQLFLSNLTDFLALPSDIEIPSREAEILEEELPVEKQPYIDRGTNLTTQEIEDLNKEYGELNRQRMAATDPTGVNKNLSDTARNNLEKSFYEKMNAVAEKITAARAEIEALPRPAGGWPKRPPIKRGAAQSVVPPSKEPSSAEQAADAANVAASIDPMKYWEDRKAIMGTGLLINYKAALNRLEKAYKAGKISVEVFADEVLKIFDKQNAAAEKKRARNFNDQNLKRGADAAIKKFIDAKIKGQISPETADFAIWFITNNPHVAKDLAVSIGLLSKKDIERGMTEASVGYYQNFRKIVRILARRDPSDIPEPTGVFPRKRGTTRYGPTKFDVGVHEILHHMERMMPPEMQEQIVKEWKRQVKKALKYAIKKDDLPLQDYLADVMLAASAVDQDTFDGATKRAMKAIVEGDVDGSFYALFNPSEFWTVNGSDILAGRYDAVTKFQKVKQWVSEFIEAAKKIFGLSNRAPIIKALNNVLKGDGTYFSNKMLREGNVTFMSIDTDAAAEKIVKDSLKANQLPPPVVVAIQNNDVNAALRGIAQNTSGFFRELATALAGLNLPTNIGFNRSRELIRRTLDEFASSNQNRLFGYIQVKYPDLYNKYFQNYDKADSLERVYEGLQELQKGKYDVGPVVADFETVLNLYDSNISALTLPGAYFPSLDAITLNTDVSEEAGSFRIALHEVVHAATMYMLLADPNTLTEGQRATVAEIKRMYEFAQTKLPPGFYGFTNIYEFVAEALTNRAFQNQLKTVQYTPRKAPLFTQLVRSILKLFGVDNLASAAMVEATQLFSAVRTVPVKGVPPVFAQGKKRHRGPITTPDSWRTAGTFVKQRVNRINKSLSGHPTWQKLSGPLKKQLWSVKNTQGRALWLPNLYLSHLAELTKNKFPQIQGAINTIRDMITLRNKYLTEAEEIVKNWSRLQSKYPKMSKLMSLIMLDSTINSVDPDPQSAGYDPAKVPPKLQNAWNSLPPEFQQLYRDVREHYKKMLNETIQEMRNRINNRPISAAEKQKLLNDLNRKLGQGKLISPYFPLRRFGDYWFQVGPVTGVPSQFKEFYTFESVADRDEAIELRKAEIQANPRLSADQKKSLIESFAAGNGFSNLLSQNIASTAALKEVQELIDNVSATNVADAKDQMKDAVDQLIYVLLPQQSVRKMFINRQAIQGASEDMLRVFATTSVHGAYQLSRFKYAEQFTTNIQNARTYVKDKYKGEPQLMATYNDYIQELENRGPQIMSNEDRNTFAVNMSNRATELTFFFMLSAPASALVNVIGMAQFGLSELGGRYNYGKAATQLTRNLLKYGATTGTRTIKPLLKGHVLQVEFPSVMEAGNLSPIQKRAAKRFIEENDVNVSQVSDMMSIGDAPSALYTGRYNMIKRAMAAIFHQAERLNREVLLLTAFDLAYEKYTGAEKRTEAGFVSRVQKRDAQGNLVYKTVTNPKTGQTTQEPVMIAETFTPQEAFEQAIQEAREVVSASLGDATRQFKPRTLATPLLKVLMQFKAYAITALTFMVHNFMRGIGGSLSAKEKDMIKKQLAADLGVTPITSGMTQAQIDAINQAQATLDQRMAEIEEYQKDLRTIGRKKMAGVLGVTFLLGGTNSIIGPTAGFFSSLGVLLRAMFGLEDEDDDEFFDFDNWFNNYCAETLGGYSAEMLMEAGVSEETAKRVGKKLGLSVSRGPAGAITGVSLSDRVSIDPLGLWIRDAKFSPDLKAELIDTAIANAGPAVGLGVNWVDAWKLMQQGQYQRAFEKAAPAMFAKPVTAERIATEGAKTAGGVELVKQEEFSSWDIAMQALGFQPEKLALKQKAAIEMKTREQKILAKRDALLDRLWLEYYIMESSKGYDEAMDKIDKFNAKYPAAAIKQKTIQESFENRIKSIRQAEDIGGAKIQKSLRNEIEPMGRYAQ